MGDKLLERAAQIAAPFGDGAANSNQRRFTCTAASKVNQIPDEFAGEWVTFKADGTNCYFMVSKNIAATVAVPAATDAGTGAATIPWPLFLAESEPFELPTIAASEHLYLVRISDGGTGSIWLTKSSR